MELVCGHKWSGGGGVPTADVVGQEESRDGTSRRGKKKGAVVSLAG